MPFSLTKVRLFALMVVSEQLSLNTETKTVNAFIKKGEQDMSGRNELKISEVELRAPSLERKIVENKDSVVHCCLLTNFSTIRDDVESILEKYDNRKGVLRKMFGDSAGIKKIKKICNGEKNQGEIKIIEADTLHKAIKDYMENALKKRKHAKLTTVLLKELEILIMRNSVYNQVFQDNNMSLRIMSYLNRNEISIFGQLNRETYHFARLQSTNRKHQLFHHDFFNRRTKPIACAIMLLLSQYKVERESKNHPIRVMLFDRIDKRHINRVNKLKEFIRLYVAENINQQHVLDAIIMVTRIDVPDFEMYTTVPLRGKPYAGFWFLFSSQDFQEAMDILFVFYLTHEINYAKKNKLPHYEKTLLNIINLLVRQLKKENFLALCNKFINLSEKTINLYKDSIEWNTCFVWRGYEGFVQYSNLDERQAKELYSTGRLTIEHPGDYSGSNGTPAYTEIVKPGIPSKIPYFYPLREREKQFIKFFKSIHEFMEEFLLSGIQVDTDDIPADLAAIAKKMSL